MIFFLEKKPNLILDFQFLELTFDFLRINVQGVDCKKPDGPGKNHIDF